jgi:CRP-like cAMP-binding protein
MPLHVELMAKNELLAALPEGLAERVAADLTKVSLKRGELLLERGEPIHNVYFPLTCMISMVVDLHSGNTVEALTVGRDGFCETAAYFGRDVATLKGIAQLSGEAARMPIGTFAAYLKDPDFRLIVGSYVEEAIAVLAQSSACLAFHPVEQRLARWLLEVDDRVDMEEFGLTHEFLAQMLGVQRPTASIAVRMLVTANLVSQRRGAVRIVDRARLEEAACECFRATKDRKSH